MSVSEITNIESFIESISPKVLSDFSEGMSTMFGIDIQYKEQEIRTEQLGSLKEQFNKQAAIYTIDVKGGINGSLHLLLDQAGMFTLPGIIVMHPKKRIEENCKKGSAEEITYILDAIKELGNLLVGSWDKIVRQELCDNTHLVQTGTYAGLLCDLPDDLLAVSADEELSFLPYEITVEPYSPFVCGIIVSKSLQTAKTD